MTTKNLMNCIVQNTDRVKGQNVPVFSVTNYHGFVPSEDQFGKKVYSKDISNYKIVGDGCLAYNPSRINVGSIALNQLGHPVAVSPMYTVFECDSSKLLPKYLLFFMKSQAGQEAIKKKTLGTVRFQLKFNELTKLPLSIPSIDVQNRVVSILEEIDDLRQKQRKAIELTRQMIPALFYEMFGDPMSNDKKICKDILKHYALSIKSGFACGKSSREASDNILHLRPMNITSSGRLSLLDTKCILIEALPDAESFSIKKDDVLFNNTNSKELVGKSCYVSQNLENTAFSNHITRIRTKQTLDSFFLATQLQIIQEKGFFLSLCNKWIGQAGINNQKLLDLVILVPPIQLQKTFTKNAQEFLLLLENQESSLQKLDSLFNALLNQFFSN